MRWRFLFAIGLVVGLAPAKAEYYVRNNPGGRLYNFIQEFNAVIASGKRVRIRGMCYSACTVVVKLLESGRLCAEADAELGFHLATDISTGAADDKATQVLYGFYPLPIRRWIASRGGLTGELKVLRGDALYKLVPLCTHPPLGEAVEAFADIKGLQPMRITFDPFIPPRITLPAAQ